MKHKWVNRQKQIVGDYQWVIYKDEKDKLWYWYKQRAKGSGETLGKSHKGFSSKQQCIYNATIPSLVNSHNWESMPDL